LKLVTYSTGDGSPKVGYIEDGDIHALGGASLLEYIMHGRDADRQPRAEVVALEEARLHVPIARPGKIVAIGLNYEDHAAETGAEIPEKPVVFAKYPNTVIGPGEPIRIPPITQQVDYEAELAVVIGRQAKGVSESEALDHVFGYTNANDVSSRDLQFSEGGQWTRSKSIDTFCPTGPYVATRDEDDLLGRRASLLSQPGHDARAQRHHHHWHAARGGNGPRPAALDEARRRG
jgi:2,4-diketo-3-deoxy-L-fuconate hydrolase